MEEWGKISKQNHNGLRTNALNKLTDGVLNRLYAREMRLRKYKSTLIDKGLNYFISVKLLILETIVSQRPWNNFLQNAAQKSSVPRKFFHTQSHVFNGYYRYTVMLAAQTVCTLWGEYVWSAQKTEQHWLRERGNTLLLRITLLYSKAGVTVNRSTTFRSISKNNFAIIFGYQPGDPVFNPLAWSRVELCGPSFSKPSADKDFKLLV